jgi:CRISPR-associated exonuclease Cas4
MKQITGLMIYYYFICHRKLWYFANEIEMEQNSELVSIGKVLDETSYQREKKSILIDNQINIDFIQNGAMLHEVKKTKSIEEAGEWQIKYYMYYLEQRGVKEIEAKVDYPLLKQTKEVFLTQEDRELLKKAIQDIEKILENDKISKKLDAKICKKCAYYDLCYI